MSLDILRVTQPHPWRDSPLSHFHGNGQAAIRQSIAEIEAQIQQLQVKLARQRALLSSNNVLPVEILARILEQYFNSMPDDPLTYPNRLAPLSVCHYWRYTALSTKAAWTTLDFTARWGIPSHPNSDVNTYRGIRTRLLRQFDRAGDRPMDLVIRYAEPRFDAFAKDRGMSRNARVANISDVLSTSAHRFQSFAEFGISSLSPDDAFFSKTFSSVNSSVLKQLRVRTLGTQHFSFPNLETLFVDGFVHLPSLANMDLPNLQTLLVGGSIQSGHREPGKFVQALKKFPRLENVTMICNANLLDYETQHTSVKALRFHEAIYPHSYTVPDSIRSLEGVCEFLQAFPNADTLTFSSSIIYIYDDSEPPELQGAEKIRNLNFEGNIEFGWRSTIDAFSAFNGVTHMKVDHAKASSAFEWDKGRGTGNLFLFELLQEVGSGSHMDETRAQEQKRLVRWPKLDHLELVGVSIDQCALNHLLNALRIRNETGLPCVLTTRQCSLSLSTLRKPIPDQTSLSYGEVNNKFRAMQAEMTVTAQNFLQEAVRH